MSAVVHCSPILAVARFNDRFIYLVCSAVVPSLSSHSGYSTTVINKVREKYVLGVYKILSLAFIVDKLSGDLG